MGICYTDPVSEISFIFLVKNVSEIDKKERLLWITEIVQARYLTQ